MRRALKNIMFPALLLAFMALNINAATIKVGKSSQFKNIASAINFASAHDTLYITQGHYIEDSVIISKPLTLIGINYPSIEHRQNEETIIISADGVVIEGLTIQHVKHSYIRDFAGIRLVEAKNCMIRNNRLIDTFFGIYLQNSKSCTLTGNIIEGQAVQEMSSGNAIHLWYCEDIIIEDNKAIRHRDGIYLEFVESSSLIGNESIENIRYGMHFMFSNHNTFFKNTFQENGTGVAVMFSEHIEMIQNNFQDNWGPASYGILLKDIKDSRLTGNVFKNNTSAVYMDNSLRLEFSGNSFVKNGWGIKLLGSNNDNTFSGNTFSGNSFDLSTDSKTSDNVFHGNYWDKYQGYDLDHNGTGDVAYNPVTLSSYIVSTYPASIILLRSIFLDVLDRVEKVTPVFIPTDLTDPNPLMEAPDKLQEKDLYTTY